MGNLQAKTVTFEEIQRDYLWLKEKNWEEITSKEERTRSDLATLTKVKDSLLSIINDFKLDDFLPDSSLPRVELLKLNIGYLVETADSAIERKQACLRIYQRDLKREEVGNPNSKCYIEDEALRKKELERIDEEYQDIRYYAHPVF